MPMYTSADFHLKRGNKVSVISISLVGRPSLPDKVTNVYNSFSVVLNWLCYCLASHAHDG